MSFFYSQPTVIHGQKITGNSSPFSILINLRLFSPTNFYLNKKTEGKDCNETEINKKSSDHSPTKGSQAASVGGGKFRSSSMCNFLCSLLESDLRSHRFRSRTTEEESESL